VLFYRCRIESGLLGANGAVRGRELKSLFVV